MDQSTASLDGETNREHSCRGDSKGDQRLPVMR